MQQQVNGMQVVQINKAEQKGISEYLILFFLIVSFVFVSMFETFKFGNGSAMVVVGETPSGVFWSYTFFLTLISWLLFELLMRAYYFFVSMSMYVFIIPKKKAYYTLRLSYIFRNLVVGAFSFLLFASPVFVNYLPVIALAIDFLALSGAFLWLKKQYLGGLLAPFAWKAFLRPFIVYQIIMFAFMLGGAL